MGPPEDQPRLNHRMLTLDGLRIGAVQIHPVRAEVTSPLVATLGIIAHLDSFEVTRFQLLSQLLSRPVIALETPGWMLRRGALPSPIRNELRRGHFARFADLLTRSLLELDPQLIRRGPSVLGYSLGASTAAALAADLAAHGARLRGLTLVEPVAIRKQSIAELTWRNVRDALHSHHYSLPGEPEADGATPSPPAVSNPWRARPLPRALALGRLVLAMSRGRIPQTLATVPTEVPLMIISGGASMLAPDAAVRRLMIQLQQQGRSVNHHVVDGAHHALWNSESVVRDVAEHIL